MFLDPVTHIVIKFTSFEIGVVNKNHECWVEWAWSTRWKNIAPIWNVTIIQYTFYIDIRERFF